MKTLVNRAGSLSIALILVFRQGTFKSTIGVGVMCLFALTLIWCGRLWNEVTLGTYARGQQIDAPTPPYVIAAFGWGALLILARLF